ncbi:MAG: ATP-binding cassette domain-containing protein, partial [Lachnospiraceae bacterium]|nr:ATP-binding cassette domain-containing protein [Lachnospiraceae bacterium]
MSYIEIRDLSFSYADDKRLILKDISLEVKKGEFVCLLGQSGCGKSTFLRLLAGLEQATRGDLRVDGDKVTKESLYRVVVFQD